MLILMRVTMLILMRVTMLKSSEMTIGEKLPAQLEFQPLVLDQLVKEVDVRLGDIELKLAYMTG